MKVNINHPMFVNFLDSVNETIEKNIKITNYFSLTSEKKSGIQYMVLKIMKNSIKTKSRLSNDETKSFIDLLQTKNELNENFELAQILKDIMMNFDTVNNIEKPIRKTKTIRLDKKENDE